MKSLIIAEKPSLARNIMAGIREKFSKCDGFCESESYVVSWAFGHLFTLCDAGDYDERLVKWELEMLPFFPEKFKLKIRSSAKTKKPDPSVKKQFEVLKKLYNRKDIDKIINAGDADREGEVIIRLITDRCGKGKDTYRLWLPDQTPETISANLKNMKRDSEYDNLFSEGFSRMCIDWLYGINLTRLASLKSNTPSMRVGRVLSPIVHAVYDRDMSIKHFIPQKYYVCENKNTVELVSKNKFRNIEDCIKRADELNGDKAVVCSIESKEVKLSPGKLYSLSKLQGAMGRKHKMKPDETLAVLQGLYEKGYVTYPRTNTEYLAEAEKGRIKDIIELLKKDYSVKFKDNYIFNDKKIESHSALTPTLKIPDINQLSEAERKVYTCVLNRFAAVFCSEECIIRESEMIIRVKDEDFSVKGRIVLSKGFMIYDSGSEKQDKILPDLKKGDTFTVDFKPVEKETQPPKPYTVETLNSYLKNPFRKDNESDNDDEEYKAMFQGVELGTEATRTGIIDNSIKLGYISLKNNIYHIEPKGVYLVETTDKLGVNMSKEKTAVLGQTLKKIYRGEISPDEGIAAAVREISEIFRNSAGKKAESYQNNKEIKPLCKCPHCAGEVIENSKAYSCGGCECVIFKDDKFFAKIGKKMNKTIAKNLLAKGRVHFDDLVSKAGKKYSADIVVNFDETGKIKYSFDFKGGGKNG